MPLYVARLIAARAKFDRVRSIRYTEYGEEGVISDRYIYTPVQIIQTWLVEVYEADISG